jgi:cellulose synthase/poly-beta-1,6-N-acetylglucosamine synthase-like glycosyltransferase
MAPLFVLIVAFGATLAVLIPSSFVAAALRELRYDGQLWLGMWFAIMAGLSLFVLTRWCAIQTLAFLEHYRTRRIRMLEAWPFVSILVPAYQEAETIATALRSLIDLDYPLYEIIVVDDGSTDQTSANALPFVGDHGRCRVELLRKPNGGKWSALNLGFSRSTGELVLCIDADSHLSRDALKRLVARMDSPDISAVSGQITVRNRRNLITRLQAYEYVVANGGLRTAQSLLGSVLVVPGPIGLYRRSALVDLANADALGNAIEKKEIVRGPFSPETFAEDFQLSLSILAHGGRIVYEPRALSYTKSPHLTPILLNQRYRWYRGTLQVLRIYRRRLRKLPGAKERRLSAMVTAIYLLDLSVLPVANLTVLFGVTISVAVSRQPGDVMLWVAAIWLLNLMTSAYHIVAQGDDFALLPLVPLYDLYHGLLLNAAWAAALFDEFRRTDMQW